MIGSSVNVYPFRYGLSIVDISIYFYNMIDAFSLHIIQIKGKLVAQKKVWLFTKMKIEI
jgi:hypothetical protein